MTHVTVSVLPLNMAEGIRPLLAVHASRMQALCVGQVWSEESRVTYEGLCAAEEMLIDALPHKARVWFYGSWLPFVHAIHKLGTQARYGW